MAKTTENQEQPQLTIEQKLKANIDYLESELKKTELSYNQIVGSLNFAKTMLADLTKETAK